LPFTISWFGSKDSQIASLQDLLDTPKHSPPGIYLEPPYLNIHANAVGLKVFYHRNILGDLILSFLTFDASIKNDISDGLDNFRIIAKYYDDERVSDLPADEDLLIKVAALINNRGYIVALGFTSSCEVLQLYIYGPTFPMETEIKGTLFGRIQEEMIVFEDGSLDLFCSGSMGFIGIQ